ncbi:MAG: AraC family transcriptional regulator [Leucobacter sp.]
MTDPRDDPGPGAWRREPSTVMRPAPVPPSEPPAPFVILAESEVVGVPLEWEPHAHPMHELVWVRGGTMTVRIGGRIFTVPEGRALWLPAGVMHAGRLTAGAELADAFFAPERTPVAFAGPTTLVMSPLLESLLLHLAGPGLDAEARARAESVVFDVLEPAERQFALQLPGDPRIDRIAEALLDDPADGRGLEEWAAELGTSERTVTRAFRRTTGLSFAQWRRVLRVHLALKLLAEGHEVAEVSERLGYAQPSTFIEAFRRVMGATPGSFTGGASRTHKLSGKP